MDLDIKSILQRSHRGSGKKMTKLQCLEIIHAVLSEKKMYKREFLEKIAARYPDEWRTRDNAYSKLFEKEIQKVCEDLDRLEAWDRPAA